MNQTKLHIPVLLNEVIEYLKPEDGKIYVDCTFGAGGYSRAVLEGSKSIVYAIDRDPSVKKLAEELSSNYSNRLRFIQGCYGKIKELLNLENITKVDGIMLDIGVSSMQLDNNDRGFSFNKDAYLDMRMSQDGVDAHYVVNSLSEEELADIIYYYGQENKARVIARKICEIRKQKSINTTFELAEIVRNIVRKSNKKIDPATKTFQAIRIYVNKELDELKDILNASESLLNIGGRLVVVTFHSLEDEIVKEFFKQKSAYFQQNSRYLPDNLIKKEASFKIITKKAVKPSFLEIKNNPRSRSSKLRAAEKISPNMETLC